MSAGATRWSGWLLVASVAVACGGRYDAEPPEDTEDGEGATVGTGTEAGAGQGGQNGGGEVAEGGGGTTAMAGPVGAGGEPPHCGGCSLPEQRVRCARHEVVIHDLPSDRLIGPAEIACEVAQSALTHAEGGAGGQGGARPWSEARVEVFERGTPAPEGDWCQSYVDLPRMYFNEGCIGYDDENRIGQCVVDGECCVVLDVEYCGI